MNTILFLILLAVVLVAAAYLFKGSNFSNRLRQAAGAANDALADAGSDGEFAIKDAQDEAAAFRSDIAGLIATNNGLERRRKTAETEVAKFENIAQKAGGAGDADGVREALVLK